MNTIKSLFLSLILFCSSLLQAITSEVTIAQRGENRIICILDRHLDNAANLRGPVQKQQILEYAKELTDQAQNPADKPFIITEDNMHYEGQNQNAKEFIKYMSDYARDVHPVNDSGFDNVDPNTVEITSCSLLENLANDSLAMNIDCYNAECRQLKYASDVDGSVSGDEVVKGSQATIEEINKDLALIKKDAEHNEDAQIVYDECSKILQTAQEKSRRLVEKLEDNPKSIKELQDSKKLQGMFDDVALYDTHLIDARMLISWYKNRDRKQCFMITGGTHINRIMPILNKLGFETTDYGTRYPLTQEANHEIVQNALDLTPVFNELNVNNVTIADAGFFDNVGSFFTKVANNIQSFVSNVF